MQLFLLFFYLFNSIFIAFPYKFALVIFLSLKCFTIFSSTEVLIGYLKNLPLEIWGGSYREEHVRNGEHSKGTCAYEG